MAKHILRLSPSTRAKAIQGAQRAPDGWIMELREPKRSDDQNAFFWAALNRIQKQRPVHMGVKMTAETWRFVFLDALGTEMQFLPKLDGDGMFPAGQRSSQLTKGEFSNLLEIMSAWCAKEGISLEQDNGETK